MTGFYLFCAITVWMIPSGQKHEMPHKVDNVVCKVLNEENHEPETFIPNQYFIDCSEELGWLKTSTRLEMWIEQDQCSLEKI